MSLPLASPGLRWSVVCLLASYLALGVHGSVVAFSEQCPQLSWLCSEFRETEVSILHYSPSGIPQMASHTKSALPSLVLGVGGWGNRKVVQTASGGSFSVSMGKWELGAP